MCHRIFCCNTVRAAYEGHVFTTFKCIFSNEFNAVRYENKVEISTFCKRTLFDRRNTFGQDNPAGIYSDECFCFDLLQPSRQRQNISICRINNYGTLSYRSIGCRSRNRCYTDRMCRYNAVFINGCNRFIPSLTTLLFSKRSSLYICFQFSNLIMIRFAPQSINEYECDKFNSDYQKN